MDKNSNGRKDIFHTPDKGNLFRTLDTEKLDTEHILQKAREDTNRLFQKAHEDSKRLLHINHEEFKKSLSLSHQAQQALAEHLKTVQSEESTVNKGDTINIIAGNVVFAKGQATASMNSYNSVDKNPLPKPQPPPELKTQLPSTESSELTVYLKGFFVILGIVVIALILILIRP